MITGFAPPRPEADPRADEAKAVALAGASDADGSSGDTAPDTVDALAGGAPDLVDAVARGTLSTRAREKAKAKA